MGRSKIGHDPGTYHLFVQKPEGTEEINKLDILMDNILCDENGSSHEGVTWANRNIRQRNSDAGVDLTSFNQSGAGLKSLYKLHPTTAPHGAKQRIKITENNL